MKLDLTTSAAPDPQTEIRQTMMNEGILPPPSLIIDGQLHRFRADSDKGKMNDAGWYIFSDQEAPYGAFGSWIGDRKFSFVSGRVSAMDPRKRFEREREIKLMMEEQKREHEEEQSKAAATCAELWLTLPDASSDNFYIRKKGLLSAYGARCQGDTLVLPLMDPDTGNVMSLQYISPSGKKYHPGARVKGCCWQVGEGTPRYLAEGFATAASVHEATGRAVLVAFSAGNLKAVHDKFPATTIVADNDESHTGEDKASEAGDYILIPEVGMDANDYATKYGLEALSMLFEKEPSYHLIGGKELLTCPAPRRWIIRDWLPEGPSLTMTFGQSGNGKTFVVLDRLLSIATGTDWAGYRTKRMKVLYGCGEDSIGVRGRIAAWCQEHQVAAEDLDGWFMMSEEAAHIDTPDGIQKLVEALEWNGFTPDIISIDTLNRFMAGDENKTVDASAFIACCMDIAKRYKACLNLVHHTGLAETAQTRARGSSAFRGALDTQDFVERSGDVFCITQTKNKNGREQPPVYLKLVDHYLDGWYDEDGNQMQVGVLETTEEKPQDERPKQQQSDERFIIHAFSNCGWIHMGRPYATYDKLVEWLAETKSGDDEEKKVKAARKDLWPSKVMPDKPRLMDRLIGYGDIEPDWNSRGGLKGFWCNPIVLNGITEPEFTMHLVNRDTEDT